MKKILLILLVGFLCNTVVAQTTSDKTEGVKIEQTEKKCSADKAKKCCSKDAKAEKRLKLKLAALAKKPVAQKTK